jgi:ribokinase
VRAVTAVRRRIAVVGHAQHVTLARVARLPAPGEILHLEAPVTIPGGGGAVAFFQLLRCPAEVHFFTAVGSDTTGVEIEAELAATGATIHTARRDQPHSRDLVLITPDGERTIMVIEPPLHPRLDDGLPWDVFGTCDAVFFTAQDADLLRAARAARVLVVTARRASVLRASGVVADVVVGSRHDPKEASGLADYPIPPRALVMTAGASGGEIETAAGSEHFPAAAAPTPIVGSYGAGDSFVGALTWYLAVGLSVGAACTAAGAHGAAVLAGITPLACQRPPLASR